MTPRSSEDSRAGHVRSFLVAVACWWWIGAAPVAAQEQTSDGRSTDDTVRLVVGGLVAIAVATAVLTLVYLWHTSPRRRQQIAIRRAADDVERGDAVANEE